MSETRCDVVISGGGPNGLMLACELALAGITPIVLERLPEPSVEQKANGMIGQVVRAMDMRGLYPDSPPRPMDGFLFSGMSLNLGLLQDNPMHAWIIPQPDLIRRLVERAQGLGVDIRWGHTLTDFTQEADSVTASVATPSGEQRFTARYLVAADGGKSLVRKRSGIDFPGHTNPNQVSRMGHATVPDEFRTPTGDLRIPGIEDLHWGHNRLERGMFIFAELQPGRPLVAVMEFDAEPVDDSIPMTFDELRESVSRVLGAELPMRPPTWAGVHALRRISGQNTRLAERYRDGRVLLLGDAAHVHSAVGGPGLNLGLQDAINLGWKLAAQIRGWAPEGLLDTYESERRPVGERVMMSSLTQSALMASGAEVTALRQLFGELLTLPSTVEHIARTMSGTDIRYDVGSDHPLAGRFFPEATVETATGPRRIAELLHSGRPLLLDLTGTLAPHAADWSDRVDTVVATAADAPAAAMLIRPDGYIAWATDDSEPGDLPEVLARWFGPARALVAD
ncbi:FAD-dependent monooxygenase [Nocardia terpenica]|uniref:FAD-dependent oxidoreductase n=1 Tax=Nocardia terpenica TaxID=455432 RepID=A0A291RJ92_9NOCA|nr:FAD-dependent monooxygenase [Nocardia terpenica]ATL67681.1 FAD-dependent oxidoreductase [Nocardia terpenica]